MNNIKRFRVFLKEGGNAIASSTRIDQENVKQTVESFYKKILPVLNINKNSVDTIGSTGKKKPGGSSGDIDIAISLKDLMKKNNIFIYKKIVNFVKTKLLKFTKEIIDSSEIGVISCGWPIANVNNNQPNSIVQIDLMFVDSLEWANWSYFSPAEWESKYKGVYRLQVIASILKNININVIEREVYNGKNIPVKWERFIINLSKGIFKVTKSIKGKKGILKNAKTIERVFETDDPKKLVKMILGPDFSINDTLSWETLWKAINSKKFIHKRNLNKILKDTKETLLKNGLPIPSELEKKLK